MLDAPLVPRAEAMADEADAEADDVTVEGFRAAMVRSVIDFLRSSFSRLRIDEVEMDRLVVLTWKRSRYLSVTPARVAIIRQTRLASVRANGTLTQRNLPAPILVLFSGQRLLVFVVVVFSMPLTIKRMAGADMGYVSWVEVDKKGRNGKCW